MDNYLLQGKRIEFAMALVLNHLEPLTLVPRKAKNQNERKKESELVKIKLFKQWIWNEKNFFVCVMFFEPWKLHHHSSPGHEFPRQGYP